jgi:hypothetical protein
MNHMNVPHQDANVNPQALLSNGNVLAIKQTILSWFCYDISYIEQKVHAWCVFLCRRRVREIPWLQRHVIGLLSNDPANDPQCWQHCNNTGRNSNEETSLTSVEYYTIFNVLEKSLLHCVDRNGEIWIGQITLRSPYVLRGVSGM